MLWFQDLNLKQKVVDRIRKKIKKIPELKEQLRDNRYSMKQLKDYRFGISFSEFEYCPYCGKKIDWETIRKDLNW